MSYRGGKYTYGNKSKTERSYFFVEKERREEVANLLLQTYTIALPILLGYIVWLLQEQKKRQVLDAKARDERIAEEYKKRDANSEGTMLLLRVQLIEYHDKYMALGSIPSYAYENFCEMYKAYHNLGGNGMVTKMKQEIEELHLRKKGD